MRQAALFLVVSGLCGCAALKSLGSSEPPPLDFSADADANLAKGDEALEGGNHDDARRYFEYVRSKFPYLEASKTAELRMADVEFSREKYIDARERYSSFTRLHPTHPKVDYAAYRVALAYYQDMPSQLFIFPAAAEKDQLSVKGALVAFRDFIKTHPKSAFVADAKKYQTEVENRLADHEWYVAGFYARRDRWPAVIGRLQVILSLYPESSYAEDAYWRIYEAHLSLKEDDKAKEVLQKFLAKMPSAKTVDRARKILGTGG